MMQTELNVIKMDAEFEEESIDLWQQYTGYTK